MGGKGLKIHLLQHSGLGGIRNPFVIVNGEIKEGGGPICYRMRFCLLSLSDY